MNNNENEFAPGCKYHMASDNVNYFEFKGDNIAVFCYVPLDGVETSSGMIQIFQTARIYGGALLFEARDLLVDLDGFQWLEWDDDQPVIDWQAIRRAVLDAVA